MGLISRSRKLYKAASEKMSPDDFSTDVYRRVAKRMYQCFENGETPEPAMILNDFEGGDLDTASSVFYNLEVYDGDEETVKELLYTIRLERLDLKIKKETNPAELSKLFGERETLLAEKNTWEE